MKATISNIMDIQNAITRIDNTNAAAWKGRASEQNKHNFNALNTMQTEYITDAQGTTEALDLAVTAYETTEQQQVTKVSNLSTEGIF
jgi:ribosomal protein S8